MVWASVRTWVVTVTRAVFLFCTACAVLAAGTVIEV